MKIESPAFKNNHPIPHKYTCEGEDVSPELNIIDMPQGTKSLAIIVDDPDAPGGVFDHWIAWNITPSPHKLPEGARLSHQGTNGFGSLGYRGPCPPHGKSHRYFFKVYALDADINLPQGSTKASLEGAMKEHILGQGQLMGTYQR